MSANVGLPTPRGSGTSGYVQRNLSSLKPRDQHPSSNQSQEEVMKLEQRKPDAAILEHERLRAIEVKVFELRDRLEDEGLDEDQIEVKCEQLRKELHGKASKTFTKGTKDLRSHQVHEIAQAKSDESERLRRALGIPREHQQRQGER
ncbi:cwf21-domain-containing protein [Piedraia hortae CBS 480.64]|uniref:Cwf21-domain-containing protein n=1 Tax=Piedraia hortae CBS 480.64 TaxID=1314780 RepID=A0A6A7BNY8_9PEZI|nr:cwf21-domain-containing protein [Piedraia hortae CBS 480.64]